MNPILDVLLGVGGKVLDKFFPDADKAAAAKLEFAKLAQQMDLAELNAAVALSQAQNAVNAEEAKSANWFISGWRPCAGWICDAGILYQFVLFPILSWISALAKVAPPPSLDASMLMTLITGMLGLAGIRGYEKFKDVARN